MRHVDHFIFVSPADCDPPHGLDLSPGSRDSIKVENLTEAFASKGFDENEPALIGYPLNGRIQLVSGTHRHEAAKRAHIRLPVHLILRSVAESLWGTPKWQEFLKDKSVRALRDVAVDDKPEACLNDRVEPNVAFWYRQNE